MSLFDFKEFTTALLRKQVNMAVDIAEPTPFETFLHYGLFIGAIFQIICIMAVVFVPESPNEKDDDEQINSTQTSTPRTIDHSRRGRKEKKKYR